MGEPNSQAIIAATEKACEYQKPGVHWDRWGMWASLACGIHCLLMPVALPLLLASGVGFVAEPWFEVLITLSVLWIVAHTLRQRFRAGHLWTFISLLLIGGILLMIYGNVYSFFFETHHHHHGHFHWDAHALIPAGALIVALGNGLNWWTARKVCKTQHHH